MGLPYHRFMVSSGRLLRHALRGGALDANETLHRLFLDERECDTSRPDHIYKSLREKEFRGIDSHAALLRQSLKRLAETYGVFRHTRLHIREEMFASWQRLITRVPPLPLVTFAVWREFGDRDGLGGGGDAVLRLLAENLWPSVLPTVVCPVLDAIIESDGLYDLHVHLNGATEADPVWLAALDNPGAVYRDLRQGYNLVPGRGAQSVREQYDQIEEGLTPAGLRQRLRLARMIRFALCEDLFTCDSDPLKGLAKAIQRRMVTLDDSVFRVRGHPVRAFGVGRSVPDTVCEGLFLWRAFEKLEQRDNARFAHLLHVYMLLMAQFTRFMVQQTDQKGFDQFQKITVNEFRSRSEREYANRFAQLARDARSGVTFLEGRFAPKNTPRENWELLRTILSGYNRHHGGRSRLTVQDGTGITETKPLRLGLVAHFIKTPDRSMDVPEGDSPRGRWRHPILRADIARKALALLGLYRRSPLIRRYLVGVDAAANELHAPPEVFAPVFRRFRHHGFCHFTYHAGEDFRHLLSGMRAVIEAVEFLGLQRGNRIGHATALGVDPALWWRRIGERVVMPREDWLDDLVFAYRMVGESGLMPEALMGLRDRIGREARALYGLGMAAGPDDLACAWRMRRHDPRRVLDPDHYAHDRTPFDRQENAGIADSRAGNPNAFALFEAWHSPLVRQRGRELVEVTDKDMPPALLSVVQKAALSRVVDTGIVLEAMLTSNVRIGVYEGYGEHHIGRWLGLSGDLPRPVVVLATDDPGIFANALRNDFIHLDRVLQTDFGLCGDEASAMVRRLNNNARVYRFQSGGPLP